MERSVYPFLLNDKTWRKEAVFYFCTWSMVNGSKLLHNGVTKLGASPNKQEDDASQGKGWPTHCFGNIKDDRKTGFFWETIVIPFHVFYFIYQETNSSKKNIIRQPTSIFF